MDDKETIYLMRRAAEEIRQLRKQREALLAKAEAYDVLYAVVNLIPGRGISMGEDVAWLLDKRIEELQPKPNPVAATAVAVVRDDDGNVLDPGVPFSDIVGAR